MPGNFKVSLFSLFLISTVFVKNAVAEVNCAATTRLITSAPNAENKTQTCVAKLPLSKPSTTPIIASVTNGGKYSLVCRTSGTWSPTASTSSCPAPAVTATKSRGIRLDPAYFYSSHAGQSAAQIAQNVVTTLKAAKVNTIYLYGYSSVYGAYYPTTYPNTTVEPGYGAQNIFGAILSQAHMQGLKVVAVMPLNNFKHAWQNNPSWRVKQAGQTDYIPAPDTYLLSASVLAYKNWYTGFIKDFLQRNPTIDQVEAVEPTLDYFWTGIPDQNAEALAAFNLKYSGAAVGSQSWRTFRAQEFLNLIALFNQTVHASSKQTALVQTWTVNSSGGLFNSTVIRDNSGFDFVGVATLAGTKKTDHLITELIWQQWFSQYGTAVFNPEWIATVGKTYDSTLRAAGSTSDLIVHVEISTFGNTVPTKAEFASTMTATRLLPNGVSVYDYNQIRTQNAFAELSQW